MTSLPVLIQFGGKHIFGMLFISISDITGQPRYLKVQGNGENTSSYPKFDIAKM